MRNILLPLFHSTSLTTFQPLVMGCADRLCSILEKEATAKRDVNMSELTSKLALDVVSTTSFGTDFGLLDTSKSDGSLDQELAREIHKTVEALRLDSAASPSIILGMVFPILQPPLHFVLERIRGTSEWLQVTTCHNIFRTRLHMCSRVKARKQASFWMLTAVVCCAGRGE